jgi:hypothetical protein
MKPERIVVRPATESDLPNIERRYGPLDNVGDPFCDTSNLTKYGMIIYSLPRSTGDTQRPEL